MTLTVLVVDDQSLTLTLTARMLRTLGYAVLTTDAPLSAIDLARGGARIDCVLTDLTMPGMSGQELARRLRKICPDGRTIHLDKPLSKSALDDAVREAIGD